MGNELAVRHVGGMDLQTLGGVLVRSGYFRDTRDQAQAIVKVLAGAELGLGPIASMQGIYIVEGKITLSAQLIGSAIQRSGKYRYRVTEWTDAGCTIEFYEGAEKLGPASFTMQDAQRAGLAGKGPWKSYPRAMLWARALSMGARAYCPEVFNGAIYVPEELGADVDEEGRVLNQAPPPTSPQETVVEAHFGAVDAETGEVVSEHPAEPQDAPARESEPTPAISREAVIRRWQRAYDESAQWNCQPKFAPRDPAAETAAETILKKAEDLERLIASKRRAPVEAAG